MQRSFLILALYLICLIVSLTLTISNALAGPTEREAALFVRNALDTSSPFSYWHGGETASPTVYFYMQHRAWNEGSHVMRHEGKKLLSCVASLLSASLSDDAKPIAATDHPRRYRILINPLPPGGGTQLAAEGLARSQSCPKGREQELILHLLMSKANPHTF
ncbi:hypothetical protein [Candidatus Entotheonella palauensis]|uniref:Uncharacterized protein n=1 Tax=Candidatus Entotheonella gemina TaxID=1429439 RepID=W4M2A1_9BACT|nr:hypothetical protein [Candidatus Entotheonella palauensis]ETX04101.1 MAG: hypothetical protein ETSY2_30750 [Candidatus Entotheonella gemina]